MGLDFSHGEAHWGYIGFMQFRTKLASEAGIALRCMEGFACTFFDKAPVNVEIYAAKENGNNPPAGFIGFQPVIKWETVKDDIVPLLNHSDCDGELSVDECVKVAPRLKELIHNWPDDDNDKRQAIYLVEGMEACIRMNEPLIFR